MDDLEPGTVLRGTYCVEQLLARGGMSRLYRGHPLKGAGCVAIKELDSLEPGGATPEDLEQFRKEYDILRGLDHPGLARALDFFSVQGLHYLVEEFVPGETLEAHLQRAGRLPHEEAVEIMEQILRVLDHLHSHHVIYRDLKPQNVILQPRPIHEEEESPGPSLPSWARIQLISHEMLEGQMSSRPSLPYVVRLVDFGAARRWMKGVAHDTVPLGTPGFAPPEQYGKAQSDARSDLYSAGVLLHCMLTGQAPDPGEGWTFEAPHEMVPDVPPELGRAVVRAVQLDPGSRFQEATEMRLALLRAVGRVRRCPRCGRDLPENGLACSRCACRDRHGWNAAALVLAVLSLAVVVAMFVRSWRMQQLDECRHSLKSIGTALEIYSTRNGGRFPKSLGVLVPNYLGMIPTCPSAGRDPESTGQFGYVSATSPDVYTIVCRGSYHKSAGQKLDFPQYSSTSGKSSD